MKTGTDVNLAECRASGYPVIEHGAKSLDINKDYLITISNPSAWTDSGQVKFGKGNMAYAVNERISYRDLWESFERGGEGIKSYCDFENCPFPTPEESPSFLDMASLAGVVHSYHGI
jgi:hypothetical protein